MAAPQQTEAAAERFASTMNIGQLKLLLQSVGVNTSGYLEKSEFASAYVDAVLKGRLMLPDESAIVPHKKHNSAIADLDSSEMERIAKQFSKNVDVRDRKYRFKTYKECFVGSEAVDYLVNHAGIPSLSREDAVQLGRLLEKAPYNLFEHVCRDHPLLDDNKFYRFLDENERKVGSSSLQLSSNDSSKRNLEEEPPCADPVMPEKRTASSNMSVGQLRMALDSKGISTVGFVEKSEFIKAYDKAFGAIDEKESSDTSCSSTATASTASVSLTSLMQEANAAEKDKDGSNSRIGAHFKVPQVFRRSRSSSPPPEKAKDGGDAATDSPKKAGKSRSCSPTKRESGVKRGGRRMRSTSPKPAGVPTMFSESFPALYRKKKKDDNKEEEPPATRRGGRRPKQDDDDPSESDHQFRASFPAGSSKSRPPPERRSIDLDEDDDDRSVMRSKSRPPSENRRRSTMGDNLRSDDDDRSMRSKSRPPPERRRISDYDDDDRSTMRSKSRPPPERRRMSDYDDDRSMRGGRDDDRSMRGGGRRYDDDRSMRGSRRHSSYSPPPSPTRGNGVDRSMRGSRRSSSPPVPPHARRNRDPEMDDSRRSRAGGSDRRRRDPEMDDSRRSNANFRDCLNESGASRRGGSTCGGRSCSPSRGSGGGGPPPPVPRRKHMTTTQRCQAEREAREGRGPPPAPRAPPSSRGFDDARARSKSCGPNRGATRPAACAASHNQYDEEKKFEDSSESGGMNSHIPALAFLVQKMTVSQLREELNKRNVDSSTFMEKSEFERALIRTVEKEQEAKQQR